MGTKTFVVEGSHSLVGDERGLIIPWTKRTEFYDWCDNLGIVVSYQGTAGNYDLWYIFNERDRILAILKWT